MSIFTDALDAIYSSDIGVDAQLSLLTESVRMVDKTTGVDLQALGHATMPTIVPAACIQRSTLDDAGITLATLIGTTLTINGATWRIYNHVYRVQPGGEQDGELFLLLRKP